MGRTPQRAVAVCALCLVAVAMLGAGGSKDARKHRLGSTATKAAVIEALGSTGYRLRYRRTPLIPGWDLVVGRAWKGRHAVEFSVEIEKPGRPGENTPNPQPPVVRYERSGREYAGNLYYRVQGQSAHIIGPGIELWSEKVETKMSIRISLALDGLVASRFREGI